MHVLAVLIALTMSGDLRWDLVTSSTAERLTTDQCADDRAVAGLTPPPAPNYCGEQGSVAPTADLAESGVAWVVPAGGAS